MNWCVTHLHCNQSCQHEGVHQGHWCHQGFGGMCFSQRNFSFSSDRGSCLLLLGLVVSSFTSFRSLSRLKSADNAQWHATVWTIIMTRGHCVSTGWALVQWVQTVVGFTECPKTLTQAVFRHNVPKRTLKKKGVDPWCRIIHPPSVSTTRSFFSVHFRN